MCAPNASPDTSVPTVVKSAQEEHAKYASAMEPAPMASLALDPARALAMQLLASGPRLRIVLTAETPTTDLSASSSVRGTL